MLNGNSLCSANISLYSAYRVYSVNSSYSVFYSAYSVILINSANTLNHSVYSVFYSVVIVRYSDLFKLVYSVLLLELNSSKSLYSVLELVSGLNGIELTNIDLSRGRILINSSLLYSRGDV